MNKLPAPDVIELNPAARVTISCCWQRLIRGHVFAHCKISATVRQLPEVLDPMRADRQNRLHYDPSTRTALKLGDYTIYTDLLDYKHPLLVHPGHPLRLHALYMGVRMERPAPAKARGPRQLELIEV